MRHGDATVPFSLRSSSSSSNRRRPGPAARLGAAARYAVERLEDRVLLASVAWDGGGDGASWTNRFNWAGDALPGAGDDAVIDVPGTVATITIPSAVTVHSIAAQENLKVTGGTLTVASVSALSLAVSGGAAVSTPSGTPLALTVSGDLTVAAGAVVGADGRGYAVGQGPGTPAGTGAGGGYGGTGGGGGSTAGGGTYGSVSEPTQLGSGGGRPSDSRFGYAGAGGGALRVVVGGTLTVDGRLSANGGQGSDLGGGGSGGGVWVTAAALRGAGTIAADGGASAVVFGGNGGGGGGRVAVYAGTAGFTGALSARGGASQKGGGAGTVWVAAPGARPTLTIDNGGAAGATTDWVATPTLDANLVVSGGAVLSHAAGGSLSVAVTGDVTIAAGAAIAADGRGYGVGQGPGTPAGTGAGAGYGGAGGAGASAGGGTYGSAAEPTHLGSGGGRNYDSRFGYAGVGGGSVRVVAGGTLTVDGRVGASGTGGVEGGGGSGGSVWVTAAALRGAGTISADGGTGDSGGGGGGGGRVAVYLPTGGDGFDPARITAKGGQSTQSGQVGTVYRGTIPPPVLAVQMQSASDTGATNGDRLTRVAAPVFDVTVNQAGRIDVDFTGDGTVDASVAAGAAGTYAVQAPALADGAYALAVNYAPQVGAAVAGSLTFTVDTAGPRVTALAPSSTNAGQFAYVDLTFDTAVDPATLTAADVSVTGPGGGPVAVTGVTVLGPKQFRATFAAQTAPGAYTVTVGPDVADLAGNAMDQDADGVNGEPADDRFAASVPVVRPVLSLALSATTLSESAANPAATGTLTRTGDLTAALTVDLVSSDPSGLTVPATVTFPAGAASATFALAVVRDGLVGPDKVVTVSASGSYVTGASTQVTVQNADVPALTVALDVAQVTEGGFVRATITRNANLGQALTVTLSEANSQSALAQFDLPAVVIPAGQASVTVSLPTVDDAVIEKAKAVTVTAAATGYAAGTAVVTVSDDDLPTLALSVAPATFGEGAGAKAAVGTVTRDKVTDQPLTVKLSSADATEATVPPTVVIPAGQASVTFHVAAVDDALYDGTQAVAVTARGAYPECGCTIQSGWGTATVSVTDDEAAALTVGLGRSSAPEGVTFAGTVTRNGDTAAALVVALASSDVTEATVPATVTIPAGAASATFDVTTIADGVSDGRQALTISATAAGYNAGSAALAVVDSDLPDLVVASVVAPSAVTTDGYFDVTARVQNNGRTTATGPWRDVYYLSTDAVLDAGDTVVGSFAFTGSIPAGQYFERTIPVRAPAQAGTRCVLVATDVDNAAAEFDEANNATASAAITVAPEYTATARTDVTTALAGTDVPIRGSARLASGAVAAFKPINVHVGVRGTDRVISAITDAAGNFTVTFRPLPGEAGDYTIGATHPGVAAADVQDMFTLLGLRADPAAPTATLIEQGPAVAGTVTLRNLGQTPLTGLAAQVVDKPANVNVALVLGTGAAGQTLGGDASLTLTYSLTATSAAVSAGFASRRP